MTVLTDPAELTAVHLHLLTPSFPAEELVTAEELVEDVREGGSEVLLARDDEGPVAVAVADLFPPGVVLLSYLAVRGDARSAGHGGRLLDAALARWTSRHDPCLVLAEVEDPALHRASAEHGDPVARLRFYRRRGARALDLPYLQPALRPGAPRVPGLLLVLLHGAPALRREPDAVDGPSVRAFLEAGFRAGEGSLPDDPEGRALLAAVGDAVPLLPLPGR